VNERAARVVDNVAVVTHSSPILYLESPECAGRLVEDMTGVDLILSRIVFVRCNCALRVGSREIVRGGASTVVFAKTQPKGRPVKPMMIEIPADLNEMVPALRDLIDAVRVQVERGRAGGSVDYAGFQREVAAKLGEVERRADAAALAALDVDAPRVLINKVLHAKVVRSATSFMGLAGPARVERSLYRPVGQRNAPVVDPVALRAGALLGEWLPATAREMAFEVQQRTSREAEASGEQRHQDGGSAPRS
jgi:hypothetical protein